MSHVLDPYRHQDRFDFLSLNEHLEAPHSIQPYIGGSKFSLFDPHWIYMDLRSHEIDVIIVNVGVGLSCKSFRSKTKSLRSQDITTNSPNVGERQFALTSAN